MSGIAGVIHLDGGPVPPGTAGDMVRAMAHRGPDGEAHWAGQGAALGQCMLHTTPQSLTEVQPLVSPDGRRVLVMDGRVDNRDELREELQARGVRLRTEADAEIVLAASAAWDDWPAHVDGDYAIAIWDTADRRLSCARDRTGARPFYYHRGAGYLAFASALPPILSLPWVPRRAERRDGGRDVALRGNLAGRDVLDGCPPPAGGPPAARRPRRFGCHPVLGSDRSRTAPLSPCAGLRRALSRRPCRVRPAPVALPPAGRLRGQRRRRQLGRLRHGGRAAPAGPASGAGPPRHEPLLRRRLARRRDRLRPDGRAPCRQARRRGRSGAPAARLVSRLGRPPS